MKSYGVRGIVACVGFDDMLSVTLPANMRHLNECVVVTSPEDERTKAVARSVSGVRVFETDAFTRAGTDGTVPAFNKGLALEEGFDVLGRHGWILVWDADTLFPDEIPALDLRPTHLHGAMRHILEDIAQWSPHFDWSLAPVQPHNPRNMLVPGFFQLFHASDIHVAGRKPWYYRKSAHAGMCDAFFSEHWPKSHLSFLPFNVLHLGPVNMNWFGRVSHRMDAQGAPDPVARERMDAYLTAHGWDDCRPDVDKTALDRNGYPVDTVDVAGDDMNYKPPVLRASPWWRRRRQRP